MSALRDIRLLVASHLDQPYEVRFAIMNLLNIMDIVLDSEGFQFVQPDEVTEALRQLDEAILGKSSVQSDFDDPELIPIEDLIIDDNS